MLEDPPNIASGGTSTIAGGAINQASGSFSTIGGGSNNSASGLSSTLAGGFQNQSIADDAFVGGGAENVAAGEGAVVTGGAENVASGDWSVVVGGLLSHARANYSLAGGYRGRAVHEGSFVWNDRSVVGGNDSLVTTAENQFLIRAGGGVGIGTDTPGGHQLQVTSDASGGSSAATFEARNTNAANGVAARFEANGTDAAVVVTQGGSGDILKAFSGGGSDTELLLENDGDLTIDGVYSGAGGSLASNNSGIASIRGELQFCERNCSRHRVGHKQHGDAAHPQRTCLG